MNARSGEGLVFVPYIYTGTGSSYTPVAIAGEFAAAGHPVTAFLPSLRAIPPAELNYRTFVPSVFPRPLRSGRLHGWAYRAIVARLLEEVRRRGPGCPVWLWPAATVETVRTLKDAGAFIIREMINSHQVTVRAILAEESLRSGIAIPATVTEESIAAENAELELADRVVSPSAGVDASLIAQGVPEAKLYRSHFGWDPGRFREFASRGNSSRTFTALFVGEVSLRKGAHLALAAWRDAGLTGEFRLVGRVSPEIAPLLAEAVAGGTVRHVPFTPDVAAHYRAADCLYFPTLEEGAPLVCYEAAAFGLPVITGPMGAARLIEHGTSGLIVEPRDHDGLVGALRLLAHDPAYRATLGAAARAAAATHTWSDAARSRVELLRADGRHNA